MPKESKVIRSCPFGLELFARQILYFDEIFVHTRCPPAAQILGIINMIVVVLEYTVTCFFPANVLYLLIDFVKSRFSNYFPRKFRIRVFPLKISDLKMAVCLPRSGPKTLSLLGRHCPWSLNRFAARTLAISGCWRTNVLVNFWITSLAGFGQHLYFPIKSIKCSSADPYLSEAGFFKNKNCIFVR